MENEIMNNGEVMENVEEIVETNSGRGAVAVAAIGAALVVGGIVIYKKVIKPVIAKVKAKKEKKAQIIDCTEYRDIDEDVVDSEEESN